MSELAAFLTTKEVAARWRISPQTLANWRCSRSPGPPYVKIGNKVLYPVEGIHAYEKHNQWLATSLSPETSAATLS